ncbi:hypothetical protein [Rugosimonospora acidiphila]|uniref:hypothetical protein n=1 Tax=Rugosimonospora acidiphila TaxID=556531 RepID=UPI0031F0B51D
MAAPGRHRDDRRTAADADQGDQRKPPVRRTRKILILGGAIPAAAALAVVFAVLPSHGSPDSASDTVDAAAGGLPGPDTVTTAPVTGRLNPSANASARTPSGNASARTPSANASARTSTPTRHQVPGGPTGPAGTGGPPNPGTGPTTATVAPRSGSAPPAVDAQATGKGTSPLTVRVTTATADDLLVAFVAGDAPASTKQKATVSGGGLTWTLAGRTDAQYGTAEVWTARASAAGTAVSVRSAMSTTGYQQELTVVAFRSSAGIGTVAEANAGTGAPHDTLTTTAANSWVFAVGNDWDRLVNRTVDGGQTLVAQAAINDSGTYWVQSTTGPTTAKGTAITIGDTAPTNDRWNLTTVEIRGNEG